jgi:class 3 adenylate cyclase/tetratricopeptide (TPR) repeat protein
MAEPVPCSFCKAPLSPTAKFCSECGAKVPLASLQPKPSAGERRQVSVLFADITGYTRLSSEIDPEELHALLGRYFDAVDRIIRDFGGTVDKHIGDAVMGVFGAPVSHGNDPERAVRAALFIHDAMRRLSATLGRSISVHIGVASGEVVAAATGSDVHREYTVLGDAVNLASRLDGLASAGETMISQGVQQAVAELIEAEGVGEVQVKGLSDPVKVFRVRGLRERATAFRTPLVGREAELLRFTAALAQTREGQGSVLHLRGEPGIGKTRLAAEMRAEAGRHGFGIHTGLVLDFGTGRGQDAISAVVLSVLGLSLDAALPEREARVRRALSEGDVTEETLAAAHDLLDLPQPPALRGPYEALSEAMRARVRNQCVVGLLARGSERSPLLIGIEDVHWADDATLGTLAALAALTGHARILLLVTSRLDGDPLSETFWSKTECKTRERLDLTPLDRDTAAALAEGLSGVDSRRLRACVERAGGNPLFLEQLLLSEAEGVLPDSVQSLVQARMDRLEPLDKRALQAAAVVGQRFSLELLRHLLGELGYECQSLEQRGLVRREGEDWLFSHALVRDGVYSSLLKQGRRDLHRQAATWFGNSDPVLRAEHLDRAEDETAPRAYLDAARSEIQAFNYEVALRLLRRGAELAKTSSDRHVLSLREGELMLYRADSQGAMAAFERALSHAPSEIEQCRAFIGMADAHRIVEAVDDARPCLDRARALMKSEGMEAEQSRLHRISGSLKFARGEDSRSDQELALDHAIRSGDLELEARALSCLGDAHYMAGQTLRAHEYFNRCIELCQRHGLQRVETYQHYMLGWCKWFGGDCRGAIRSIEHGVELASRSGHLRAEMLARETLGLVLGDAGVYERSLEELDAAFAQAQRMGSRMFGAVVTAEKVEVLIRAGREEEARSLAAGLHDESFQRTWWFARPMVTPMVAWMAPSHEAMDSILNAGGSATGLPSGSMMMLFHARAAEACLARDNHARAALHARTLLEMDPDSRYLQRQARQVLALVEYAQGSRDPALLERLSELRAEAELGGYGTAIAVIDRALGG